MYKENTKYKLTGYKPVGLYHSEPRTEVSRWTPEGWVRFGSNKLLTNFIIKTIDELK